MVGSEGPASRRMFHSECQGIRWRTDSVQSLGIFVKSVPSFSIRTGSNSVTSFSSKCVIPDVFTSSMAKQRCPEATHVRPTFCHLPCVLKGVSSRQFPCRILHNQCSSRVPRLNMSTARASWLPDVDARPPCCSTHRSISGSSSHLVDAVQRGTHMHRVTYQMV